MDSFQKALPHKKEPYTEGFRETHQFILQSNLMVQSAISYYYCSSIIECHYAHNELIYTSRSTTDIGAETMA